MNYHCFVIQIIRLLNVSLTNKACKEGQHSHNDDWNEKNQHHKRNTAWIPQVNRVADTNTLRNKGSLILQSILNPIQTSELT